MSKRWRSIHSAASVPPTAGGGIGGGLAMGRQGPETLSEALARLDALGYREDLRASPHGLKASPSQVVHQPESFVVDEVVRFEGESDPDDEAVLFALRCPEDGLRGTYVVPYGPGITPIDAERVRALHKVVEKIKGSR